jgi:hypothetical protein
MLPQHYKTNVIVWIKYMLIMLLLGLVMGIVYAESAKKVPLTGFGVDTSFYANYLLSLLHGHTMMFGVFIPLAIVALLLLPVVLLKTKPLSANLLRAISGIYIPSAVVSVGLLLYKAYATQLMVRGGNLDFVAIDHALFGANHTLRVVIYALPHTGFAIGLLLLIVGVWKSLSTAQLTE